MSISTTPIRAADGLQPGQKMAQPAAADRAPGAPLTERAVTMPTEVPGPLAARAASDAKAADVMASEAGKASAEQTKQSLQEINKVMDALSISVQFQVDPGYKEAIIKVVDQQSGKVIRQFPSEDVVRISKALDNLKGLLFAQSA